jgi:hypothetical protein
VTERLLPPATGLAAMRIGVEFGAPADFADSLERALVRGGDAGATLTAALDRGDLAIHIPRVDGPCWNAVPLFHLVRGGGPAPEDWATTSGILEKLERYR